MNITLITLVVTALIWYLSLFCYVILLTVISKKFVKKDVNSHSVVGLWACVSAWSYTKSLLAQYLTNHLWEFHQIYNLSAVGEKMGSLDFMVTRSKVRVIAGTNALFWQKAYIYTVNINTVWLDSLHPVMSNVQYEHQSTASTLCPKKCATLWW